MDQLLVRLEVEMDEFNRAYKQNCSEILPQSLWHYIWYCVEEESRISCPVISFALCFMFNISGYVTGPNTGGVSSALAGIHCFDT